MQDIFTRGAAWQCGVEGQAVAEGHFTWSTRHRHESQVNIQALDPNCFT
jgi:hypothetical protein